MNSSLTINGNNHIINANGNSVFEIDLVTDIQKINININNITIKNSVDGAIKINNGGSNAAMKTRFVYISNSHFINNTATNGGALYFTAQASGMAVQISNCEFVNNTASNSGGAVCYATKYLNDDNRVENCNFSNNKASTAGTL